MIKVFRLHYRDALEIKGAEGITVAFLADKGRRKIYMEAYEFRCSFSAPYWNFANRVNDDCRRYRKGTYD